MVTIWTGLRTGELFLHSSCHSSDHLRAILLQHEVKKNFFVKFWAKLSRMDHSSSCLLFVFCQTRLTLVYIVTKRRERESERPKDVERERKKERLSRRKRVCRCVCVCVRERVRPIMKMSNQNHLNSSINNGLGSNLRQKVDIHKKLLRRELHRRQNDS